MNLHQKYYHFQKGFQMVADAAKGIPDRVPIYAQICETLCESWRKK